MYSVRKRQMIQQQNVIQGVNEQKRTRPKTGDT